MQFSKKQNEYIRKANKRWGFKIGAVRSGKTYVDISVMIPLRLRNLSEKSGLNVILGVSKETIERNVLQPMREIWTSDLVGTINSRNIAYVFGVPVYCLGAEKVSQVAKIQGASIKYCYGDEIAKWNKDVFAMLQSRLDKPYSCFDGTCNPEYPSHWLKEFIDRDDIDSFVQEYTIFDNPYLPKKFVEDLKLEYAGTVYYDRYILGLWALAEGIIYKDYKVALADTSEIDVSEINHRDLCLSVDYGTMNPFAVLLWAKVKNVWYAVDEYYYSGRATGTTKTDSQYADDIYRWLTGLGLELSREDKIELIIDPSASSMKSELKLRGFYKIRSADNDVINGIQNTATAMQLGLIKFSDSLENWQNEIQGYAWMDDPTEDRPIKEDDHLMDAMRYFVQTKRLVRKRKKNAQNN